VEKVHGQSNHFFANLAVPNDLKDVMSVFGGIMDVLEGIVILFI